jgi:hypothetical protein
VKDDATTAEQAQPTPREADYHIVFREGEDDKSPVLYEGLFRLRAVETPDRADIAIRRAALLSGASVESVEESQLVNLQCVATILQCVVKMPDGFPATATGLLGLHPNVNAHLAAQIGRHTNDYFRGQDRPRGLDALKRGVPGGIRAAATRV